MPSYIVEANTDQVLRTIFHRTNRAGRRLGEEDVFNALFGSLSTDQPSDLRQLAQRSSELDFGPLAESDVLNALLVDCFDKFFNIVPRGTRPLAA